MLRLSWLLGLTEFVVGVARVAVVAGLSIKSYFYEFRVMVPKVALMHLWCKPKDWFMRYVCARARCVCVWWSWVVSLFVSLFLFRYEFFFLELMLLFFFYFYSLCFIEMWLNSFINIFGGLCWNALFWFNLVFLLKCVSKIWYLLWIFWFSQFIIDYALKCPFW